MKTILTFSLMMILAISAQAGMIHDIQTGVYPEGFYATPTNLIVVAVTYNGIFVSEAPHGAYDGIWVYTGDHSWMPGDHVSICAEYKEYFDLSELDVVSAGAYGSVTFANGGPNTLPVPPPSLVTAAELLADEEMWESCQITIVDGMEVTDTTLGFGEWYTTCEDGSQIRFDDFWVDFDTVLDGTCYPNATGIYYYGYGAFKLEAFEDGLVPVNCGVATEALSLDSVKALYR